MYKWIYAFHFFYKIQPPFLGYVEHKTSNMFLSLLPKLGNVGWNPGVNFIFLYTLIYFYNCRCDYRIDMYVGTVANCTISATISIKKGMVKKKKSNNFWFSALFVSNCDPNSVHKPLHLDNSVPLFITRGHMTRSSTPLRLIVSLSVQMTHWGSVCKDGFFSWRGGCFYWPTLANEAASGPLLRKGVYT